MQKSPLYIPTMRVFEMNYLRLTQLIPQLQESDEGLLYAVSDQQGVIRIHLREQGSYTATLDVTHQTPGLKGLIPDIQLAVKVYFDAEMAEVVCYQNQEQFKPRNPYPNPQMHHRQEKTELNHFLTEWLDYCLKQRATTVLASGAS